MTDPRTCALCYGLGRIEHENDKGGTDCPVCRPPCDLCGGAGWVRIRCVGFVRCSECGGAGWVAARRGGVPRPECVDAPRPAPRPEADPLEAALARLICAHERGMDLDPFARALARAQSDRDGFSEDTRLLQWRKLLGLTRGAA